MKTIKALIAIPLAFLSVSTFAASNSQVLRLNALSEIDGNYNFGNVKLCSTNNRCLSYNLNKNVHLLPKKNGEANFIGTVRVPVGTTINSIEFKATSKDKSNVNGRINLLSPLSIEEDLNYQALFTLKNISTSLYPTTVNTHYYRNDIRSIFYNPTYNLESDLKYGVKLEIPAHALKEPQIFTVSAYDIGQSVPMVDLFPYIKLEKNLTLTFPQSTNNKRTVDNNGSTTLISDRTEVFDENSFKITSRAASKTCDQIISPWRQTLTYKEQPYTYVEPVRYYHWFGSLVRT